MIVTLLLWLVLGWFLGILVFFTGGFATLPLGADRRNWAANYYSRLAAKLMSRMGLIERGTGYDIVKTSHDPEKNADGFRLGDKQGHVSNETGLLSTLHKKPFGMIGPPDEDVAVYESPELGELGEIESHRLEQGELEDGYEEHVTLDPQRPMVRLREYGRRMIPGSRTLWDLDETVDLYKQSQALFKQANATDYMILIVAYSVGALLTWLIVTNAGGAVPSSVDVPSMMLMPGVGL